MTRFRKWNQWKHASHFRFLMFFVEHVHWQKNVVMDVIEKKFVKIKYFFPEFFLVHHHMREIFLSTGEFAKTLTHTVITGSQRLRHANTQCFDVLARAVWHRAWAVLLSVDRVNLHMVNLDQDWLSSLPKLEKRDRKSVVSIIKAS